MYVALKHHCKALTLVNGMDVCLDLAHALFCLCEDIQEIFQPCNVEQLGGRCGGGVLTR